MKHHKETRAKRSQDVRRLEKYKRFHKFSVQQTQRGDAKTQKTRKSEVRLQRPGGRPYVGPLGAWKNIQNVLIFISFEYEFSNSRTKSIEIRTPLAAPKRFPIRGVSGRPTARAARRRIVAGLPAQEMLAKLKTLHICFFYKL